MLTLTAEANTPGVGPGGNCPILARVALGDGEPITALTDGGSWIRCEERTPRWEEKEEDDERPQVETLFDLFDDAEDGADR